MKAVFLCQPRSHDVSYANWEKKLCVVLKERHLRIEGHLSGI